MIKQGWTSRSRWWISGVVTATCLLVADRLVESPTKAAGVGTLPREVLAVRQAVRQKMLNLCFQQTHQQCLDFL